jgi:flavin reductase (DIM6/NTAB) family NADH-FMN oxidoreductase RutF
MTPPKPSPETPSAAAASASPDGVATALGRIPSGLFVITWRETDRDRGMLASWVMQAGFAPPLVTVAVAPGRDLLAAIEAGATFVVNVLADTQRPLLARFGKPAATGEDLFSGLGIGRAACGAPTLDGAVAWLECVPVSRTAGGDGVSADHVVVLARVNAAAAGPDATPLVHLRKNGLRY